MGGDFVSVSINDIPAGIYCPQERFHKDPVESQRFTGILFKIEEDMVVDKEDILMNNPATTTCWC